MTQEHRLVYLAGVLVIIHFLWLVKEGREPLRWGIVVAVLLILRIPQVRKTVSNGRRPLVAGWKAARSPEHRTRRHLDARSRQT